MDILRDHRVKGVRGNNECNILHNSRDESAAGARQGPLAYLQGLPYTIVLGDLWFAHSAPLSYPAATRRPVSEFLPLFMKDRAFAFSILFRGHSHRPSILEIRGHTTEKIPVQPGVDIPLDRRGRYIVTVGAVEAASSVLFMPREYAVRFVTVQSRRPRVARALRPVRVVFRRPAAGRYRVRVRVWSGRASRVTVRGFVAPRRR